MMGFILYGYKTKTPKAVTLFGVIKKWNYTLVSLFFTWDLNLSRVCNETIMRRSRCCKDCYGSQIQEHSESEMLIVEFYCLIKRIVIFKDLIQL